MDGDPVREDWPLGPELKRHREEAGLSQRAASRLTTPRGKTKPIVSAGRWKQLETGWQKNKGALIPIGTTARTVAAAARAVDWDIGEAFRIAGFRSTGVVLPPMADANGGIGHYTDDELLGEVRRRMSRPPPASGLVDDAESDTSGIDRGFGVGGGDVEKSDHRGKQVG